MDGRLTSEQAVQLSLGVMEYISNQREAYAPRAVPLSAEQCAAMEGFFSPALLRETRLLVLRGERVRNPPFYPMLRALGFDNLPDQQNMAAITFSDIVVSHQPFSDSLLFHELVHVEQYRQLGIPRFADLYVRGFLAGGSYERIPLELNALALEKRCLQDPAVKFSAADDVQAWMVQERF